MCFLPDVSRPDIFRPISCTIVSRQKSCARRAFPALNVFAQLAMCSPLDTSHLKVFPPNSLAMCSLPDISRPKVSHTNYHHMCFSPHMCTPKEKSFTSWICRSKVFRLVSRVMCFTMNMCNLKIILQEP